MHIAHAAILAVSLGLVFNHFTCGDYLKPPANNQFFSAIYLDMSVCLTMIVKNESDVIRQALESIKAHITSWCIVDTGSTDDTMDIIREVLKDVSGTLHQRPWVNFGHNRSEALKLADGMATWLFMLDADDLFSGSFDGLDETVDGYNINLSLGNLRYHRVMLFKSGRGWVYKYPLHEYPHLDKSVVKDFSGCSVQCRSGISARSKNPKKYHDDAQTLENSYETSECKTRTAFYTAQSWRDAGNSFNAIKWYKKRLELGGWAEELYVSCLNLVKLTGDIKWAWSALKHNPKRKEATYVVLERYRRASMWSMEVYALGLFSMMAKPPGAGTLFLEQDIYDYKFYDEFSIHAFYLGQKSHGAAELALLKCPLEQRERISKNVDFCHHVI